MMEMKDYLDYLNKKCAGSRIHGVKKQRIPNPDPQHLNKENILYPLWFSVI
jgi:hypothetical protein